MLSVHIVVYLTLISCDMLIKVKTTQTSHSNLLITTYMLSLLLSSTTSFPYSILAILAMIFHLLLVSITLPTPEFAGNITLTYKMSQLHILQSFLRLILTMPNTSSPLGRLRMPDHSNPPASHQPVSYISDNQKPLEKDLSKGCGQGKKASPH